jgi:phosphopantetheinyl transferase
MSQPPFATTGCSPSPEGRVDLWICAAAQTAVADELCEFSIEEQARANRYVDPVKRRQFLIARGAGRRIVASYLQCLPEQVLWPAGGPPCVAAPDGRRPISISLSHSAQFVALAVGQADWGVGVDIEIRSAPLNVDAVAAMALHPVERQQLYAAPERDRPNLLRRYWTLKEAALKSLGRPQLPPLPSVLVDFARQRVLLEDQHYPALSFAYHRDGDSITATTPPSGDPSPISGALVVRPPAATHFASDWMLETSRQSHGAVMAELAAVGMQPLIAACRRLGSG